MRLSLAFSQRSSNKTRSLNLEYFKSLLGRGVGWDGGLQRQIRVMNRKTNIK